MTYSNASVQALEGDKSMSSRNPTTKPLRPAPGTDPSVRYLFGYFPVDSQADPEIALPTPMPSLGNGKATQIISPLSTGIEHRDVIRAHQSNSTGRMSPADSRPSVSRNQGPGKYYGYRASGNEEEEKINWRDAINKFSRKKLCENRTVTYNRAMKNHDPWPGPIPDKT